MSRQKDIDNLTADIEAKQKELQELQRKVQTYSQEVQETITATLKKAGVFEKVNKLEEERRTFQQEAQQKAQQLQADMNDLAKMRNWLVGQENAEKAEEPEPAEEPEKKPSKKAKAKDDPDLKVVEKAEEGDENADGDGEDAPKKPSL